MNEIESKKCKEDEKERESWKGCRVDEREREREREREGKECRVDKRVMRTERKIERNKGSIDEIKKEMKIEQLREKERKQVGSEEITFGLVSFFNGLSNFRAKGILVEEQKWYNLTHIFGDKEVHASPSKRGRRELKRKTGRRE